MLSAEPPPNPIPRPPSRPRDLLVPPVPGKGRPRGWRRRCDGAGCGPFDRGRLIVLDVVRLGKLLEAERTHWSAAPPPPRSTGRCGSARGEGLVIADGHRLHRLLHRRLGRDSMPPCRVVPYEVRAWRRRVATVAPYDGGTASPRCARASASPRFLAAVRAWCSALRARSTPEHVHEGVVSGGVQDGGHDDTSCRDRGCRRLRAGGRDRGEGRGRLLHGRHVALGRRDLRPAGARYHGLGARSPR